MSVKNNIKKGITIRYVLALSLIAVLSTIAFIFLQSALDDSNSTAFIVNISGKQRMLSQHIALDVHRIHENLSHHDSAFPPKDMARQLLEKNTQDMLIANQMLSSGTLTPDKQSIKLSPVIHEMYFGQMNLAQRVKEYTGLAQQILVLKDDHQAHKIVEAINDQSEALLRDLNKAVQQYEIEGEEKLHKIRQMDVFVWVLTIFILLLEVIFIFQPLSRRIAELSEAEERAIENLQYQVEIRTLHLQQINQKLEDLASHDPLTGLKNRLNFEQDLEHIITQHVINHAPYAVLMLDIDWFKKVNDDHGHDVGDFFLIELAKLLRHTVRNEDKIYRVGGEEFVILLNRVSYDHALKKSEKIRQAIQSHTFEVSEVTLHKTVSGGLFHSSLSNSTEVKSILKLTDNALYLSKSKGRNRISIIQASTTGHTE